MFGISSGNAVVPSEREHDDHHAHTCCDCEKPFSLVRLRPAGECVDGDLCQACLEAREALEAE